jgi:nucleotidyltransferase/DNA polymerase involved in DNA repair
MSLQQARARCNGLLVHPAARSRYQEVFRTLLEALTTFTPQVEPEEGVELRADARPGGHLPFVHLSQMDDHPTPTCYLDLGKLKPEAAQVLAQQLHHLIREQVGTPAKLGLASGKFTARAAASAVGAGEVLLISPGEEAVFLAEFPITLLPVDGETLRQLDLLGLSTLGQVAALPVAALLDRFGKQGRIMHRLANGRDTSPVMRYIPPVMERMSQQWDSPLADWTQVEALLDGLVETMLTRLFENGQAVRHLSLVLTQEDGTPLERSVALRQPSVNVRHLRDTVADLARSLAVAQGLVGVELVLSDLEPAKPRQLSLFEREAVSQAHLNTVLHDLVARYGGEHFYWLCAADPDARLPERRFRWEKADRP